MKFPWYANLLFLSLLSLGVSALGEEVEKRNDKAFLIGFFEGLSPNEHSYWISRNLLPGKVSWQAGKEPFPLTLDTEVRNATAFLVQTKQITHRHPIA